VEAASNNDDMSKDWVGLKENWRIESPRKIPPRRQADIGNQTRNQWATSSSKATIN
jgi:hypothetical protein